MDVNPQDDSLHNSPDQHPNGNDQHTRDFIACLYHFTRSISRISKQPDPFFLAEPGTDPVDFVRSQL